ncbi:MAG: hypothetical protein QW607_04500 [Desulfurococcaceae archaeon]
MKKKEGKEWVNVILRRKVRDKLLELRSEFNTNSISDTVKKLIEFYEKTSRERVKLVMCNDFKNAVASVSAWAKLLMRTGLSKSEISKALGYLTGTADELRVDKNKCME